MNVEKLQMDKDQARDLWRRYQESRAGMTPNDRAIAAIYKRIAQGRLVIRALASITAAGLGADGLPKLAIMRADQKRIRCCPRNNEIAFACTGPSRARDVNFELSMPGSTYKTPNREAFVPLIPVHLRPRKAIEKYHVLWEADWNQYPTDPYLLRRFGADAWLVVAAWDLTDVERAVMSTQLHG